MHSSLCISDFYSFDYSYNGIDHSNSNLNNHTKMATNNVVNTHQTSDKRSVPG